MRETNGAGAKPAAEIFAEATGEELGALLGGWREHVLALEAPSAIYWIALVVTKAGPDEDLRTGDLVWSFDGVEVFALAQFQELWKKRAKDRPIEVVVVRSEPSLQAPDATRRFVRVTLQPKSAIALTPQGELERHGALSD